MNNFSGPCHCYIKYLSAKIIAIFPKLDKKIYLSSFEGANLEGAEFTSSGINNSVFDDAKMRAAKVNLATIGDCSFVDCDLFVVDFSEAFLNNRGIELIRKARIFNLENLDR